MPYYINGNQRVDTFEDLDPVDLARIRKEMLINGLGDPNDLGAVLDASQRTGKPLRTINGPAPAAAPPPSLPPPPPTRARPAVVQNNSTETVGTFAPGNAPPTGVTQEQFDTAGNIVLGGGSGSGGFADLLKYAGEQSAAPPGGPPEEIVTNPFQPPGEGVTGDPFEGISEEIKTGVDNPVAFQPVEPGGTGIPRVASKSNVIGRDPFWDEQGNAIPPGTYIPPPVTPGINSDTGEHNAPTTSTSLDERGNPVQASTSLITPVWAQQGGPSYMPPNYSYGSQGDPRDPTTNGGGNNWQPGGNQGGSGGYQYNPSQPWYGGDATGEYGVTVDESGDEFDNFFSGAPGSGVNFNPRGKPQVTQGDGTYYSRLPDEVRETIDNQVLDYWRDTAVGKGARMAGPPDQVYEDFAARYFSLAGDQSGGQQGGNQPPSGITNRPEVATAMSGLLGRIASQEDPEKLNALLQTYLGLSNLGQQDFFTGNFGPAAQSARGLGAKANAYGDSSYNMPNAPNLDPAQVYSEGAPGADMMQYALDQVDRTNIPLENLRKLAGESAEFLETRSGDLVNPYRAQQEEQFDQQMRDLESSLAARGMLSSTQADEARNRLQEAKARAMADADLRFYQTIGSERRADTGVTGDLLSGLFNQQMEGSKFALDKVGALAGVTGAAESMDINRRSMEQSRAQMEYENLMQNLMTKENISTSRLQTMAQPIAMLLSAITGTNVSPGVLGQLQMPAQRAPGPGFMEWAGQTIPGMIPEFETKDVAKLFGG